MKKELRINVIVSIVETLRKRDIDLGKVQFQKLIYFLQEMGIPLGYRYEIYHYGPYSFELAQELNTLDTLGIVNVAPDPTGYGYGIMPGKHIGDFYERKDLDVIEPYKKQIDFVLDHLGRDGSSKIELKATIHYVNKVMGKIRPAVTTESILNRVRELKPKFNEPFLSECYKELQDLNLLH